MGLVCIKDHRTEHSLCDESWLNGCAQCEVERLRAEIAQWEKLRDPVMLHANLLRGIPGQLDRATFLHLAGDETPTREVHE